jgi:hypothetical protein
VPLRDRYTVTTDRVLRWTLMSMAQVYDLVETLPWVLREQILGYVSAVNNAVPEIALDAKAELTVRLRDDIIIIAALKKLHAILAIDRWAIDRMLSYLERHEIATVAVGAQSISRGDGDYRQTGEMLRELNSFLAESRLFDLVMMRTYVEIASTLSIRYRES